MSPLTDAGSGETAPNGGLRALTAPVLLADSITEAIGCGTGAVVVTGSHGGASVVRYAIAAQPRLVVFNDAGVGLDRAGIAALATLQDAGIAACTVAHDSARIGEAASTWETGVLSHANAAAEALGARPGLRLRDWWLSSGSASAGPIEPAPVAGRDEAGQASVNEPSAESSPARR